MKTVIKYDESEKFPYLALKEIYSNTVLETEEGNEVAICMRDNTIEFNIMPKGTKKQNWYRVNMEDATIEKMQ